MKVVLVDKERSPISPIFKKGISKAKTETGLVEVLVYESHSKAPSEIKEKPTKDSYYLIIDEEVNKIELGQTLNKYLKNLSKENVLFLGGKADTQSVDKLVMVFAYEKER